MLGVKPGREDTGELHHKIYMEGACSLKGAKKAVTVS